MNHKIEKIIAQLSDQEVKCNQSLSSGQEREALRNLRLSAEDLMGEYALPELHDRLCKKVADVSFLLDEMENVQDKLRPDLGKSRKTQVSKSSMSIFHSDTFEVNSDYQGHRSASGFNDNDSFEQALERAFNSCP